MAKATKKVTKIKEVPQTEYKTLNNQWYKGDESITLTASEFIAYKVAVDQAMSNLVTTEFPEVSAYVNATTGEYAESPTEEEIENKEVVYVVSPERTFTESNRKVSYSGKITQELLTARELSMVIHQRNIEAGLTTNIDDLKKDN
jgi:hypothetical protein